MAQIAGWLGSLSEKMEMIGHQAVSRYIEGIGSGF
jgi:hypothetical protein